MNIVRIPTQCPRCISGRLRRIEPKGAICDGCSARYCTLAGAEDEEAERQQARHRRRDRSEHFFSATEREA